MDEKKKNKNKNKVKVKNKDEGINRRVIWLAGFTLFTALVWVALHSYHELARKDRMEDVEQLLTPLKPELKEEVLDKIRERKEYKLEEVEEFLRIEPTSIPTPAEEEEEIVVTESPEPTGAESEGAVATEAPEATESGGINE